MARPVWKGSIAFGLVNIPVGLHVAVQEHRLRFNQLERGTASRIRYRRVNEETGEEVPLERIARGYPLGEGRYVVLDDDELAAAAPKRSRTIELLDFVDGEAIDPMLYATPYYLVPDGEAGRRPYLLLAAALARSGRVGIATFVLRDREHLAAIRSRGPTLLLETMRFAEEVRGLPAELEGLEEVEAKGRELEIALSLVESMEAAWDPSRYRDTYRERVEELVEEKAKGNQLVVEAPSEAVATVVDLVAVLSRSVEEARKRRTEPGPDGRSSALPAKGASRPAASRGDRRATVGAKTGEDLSELSRDELYRLARERQVPGRSSMDRAQLLEAVRSGPAGAAAQRRRRAS